MAVELAYREYGAGPSLLILHGLFGSSVNWNSIAKNLARDYRVWSLDLRNHGESPHTETMDYEHMAEDVRVFMERHQLGEASIIGHSMGGKVAMVLALLNASLVRRLVVVDIAPVAYEHEWDWILDPLEHIDLGSITSRAAADEQLQDHIKNPAIRAFLLQNLRSSPQGYHWRINLSAIRDNLPSITGFDVREPAPYLGQSLFLHGERSPYVRDEYQAQILRYFPNAEIRAVSNAGHWVHAEQPGEFLQQVREFLSEKLF